MYIMDLVTYMIWIAGFHSFLTCIEVALNYGQSRVGNYSSMQTGDQTAACGLHCIIDKLMTVPLMNHKM